MTSFDKGEQARSGSHRACLVFAESPEEPFGFEHRIIFIQHTTNRIGRAQHDHRLAVRTYRPIFPSISSCALFRLAEMQQAFPTGVGTVRLSIH